MSEKLITVIPAKPSNFSASLPGKMKRRKVAAYARVSTEKDEQLNSYEAQVDYYTTYIKSNPEWDFVEVYADEGITGTNTKKRDGFNRMVQDALDGKIDLILTKSVSRFARNTVDSLTAVRKLKEKAVEVFFEKENIYTLDSKGELLITIMSSLAQEEARNIASNTAWGRRKTFADGKVTFAYSSFLGYEMGKDGNLQIVEEQAEIVRRIYRDFLAGKTAYDIATRLTEEGIPTPMKKTVWQVGVVESILHNEKYKGDAILQKRFTVDFLTKKTKINEGEYPQYYIENNHPPIVSAETFEMVQEEFERRKAAGGFMRCVSPFSGRIICGDCGGFYGRKVWHSNTAYRSYEWHCNNKFAKRKYCSTPTIKTEAIEKSFVDAFNSLLAKKDEIAENYRICLDAITDDTKYVRCRNELDKRIEHETEQMREFLFKRSKSDAELDKVNEQYNKYVAVLDDLQREQQEMNSKIALCAAKKSRVKSFLKLLKKQKTPLMQFDPLLWQAAVNQMIIYHDMSVKFILRDGSELPWTIERGVREYDRKNSPYNNTGEADYTDS